MKVAKLAVKILSLAGMLISSFVLLGTVGALELGTISCCDALGRVGLAVLIGILGFVIAVIINYLEAVRRGEN